MEQINNTNNMGLSMHQSFYQLDPISYNNCVLTHNIAYLSSIPVHELFYIRSENQKLKNENQNLINENQNLINENHNLKKRIADYEYIKSESEPEYKKQIIVNRFKPYFVAPSKYSWTREVVSQTIESIKSINDIIKLNYQWHSLKHDQTLQRLYYLIPALTKLQNMIGLSEIKKDIFKKIIYYIQNQTKWVPAVVVKPT
jgi:hypothetical protein